MTRQTGEAVYSVSHRGAIVVVEANHICMIARGIEKIRSSTATIAVLGISSSQYRMDRHTFHVFRPGLARLVTLERLVEHARTSPVSGFASCRSQQAEPGFAKKRAMLLPLIEAQ